MKHDADQRHRDDGRDPGQRDRQLMRHRAADADEAPSIRSWPCAKLTIWHGVEDQQQTERDQRVDASKRQSVDDELTHRKLSTPASLIGPITPASCPCCGRCRGVGEIARRIGLIAVNRPFQSLVAASASRIAALSQPASR